MGKYDDAIGGVNINLSINEVLDEKSHKKVIDKIDEVKKKAEEPIKVKIDSDEMNELLKQEKEIVKTIKQLSHLKVDAKGISGLLNGNMSKADIQKTIDALSNLYEVQNKIRRASGNTKRIGSDFLSGFSANDIKIDLLPKLQAQLSELNKLGLDNIEQLRERERLHSRLSKITKKDLEHAKARIVDGGDAEVEAKAVENVIANRRQVVEEMKTSGLFNEQEIKDIERQNKGLVEQAKLLREIRVAKVKDGEKIVVQKDDVTTVNPQPKTAGGDKKTPKSENPIENADAIARGNESKAFVAQFEDLRKEFPYYNKWFGKWHDFFIKVQEGALTAAEAMVKFREEMSKITSQPAEILPHSDYDSPARPKPAEMGKWKKAKFFSLGLKDKKMQATARDGRTDGNYNYYRDEISKLWHVIDQVTGMSTSRTYTSYKEAQEDTYRPEMQAAMAKIKYDAEKNKQAIEAMHEAQAQFNDTKVQEPAPSTNEQVEANKKLKSSYEGLVEAVEEFLKIRDEKRNNPDKFWELDGKEEKIRQRLLAFVPEGTEAHKETYAKLAYRLNREERKKSTVSSAEEILGIVEGGINKAKEEQNRLAEEAAVRAAEEARLAKEREEAERQAAELARQRAEEEARIASEKAKQLPQGSSGTQQEIKFQEELQKKIEDTNRIINIQKRWLDYLDPVLDESTFKTSGKREATEQLKTRTWALMDFRQHPDNYAHLSDYETKVELAQSQAYKEAERQGVALSTLNRYHTDAVYVHDQNIKKLQDERALHVKILADAERELEVLRQQLDATTNMEKVRKHKFAGTINGNPSKFSIKKSEPQTYETESGQMSILPVVEAEVNAKERLADANKRVSESQSDINEASEGTQLTIDDIIPSGSEDSTPKTEEESRKLDKIGEAAEKAANAKHKLAEANKEVAASTGPSTTGLKAEVGAMEDVGEAAAKFGSRPGVSIMTGFGSEEMNSFNLPIDYFGEKGEDAVKVFAKLKGEIEELTGKPVTIDFVSKTNEESGQLEAVGATLKYVNEEAGITVKQFYDIKKSVNDAGEDIFIATQSHEKATLAASKAAKVFNTEMQQKVALEQIKTLEGQMGSLELDLTEVKNAANAINDKASLEHFNLALRAAKEQAKQLKTELKGQNTLDTIASMERALLTLPSRLEEMQRRLNALGDIEGADAIDDILRSINEEYQLFLNSTESEDKVKLFRSLTSSMVWAHAEMRNLSGKNSEIKRQETAVEKEELAKQKSARIAYINWWKTTLNEQDEVDSYEASLLERERKEKEKDERVIEARRKKEEAYNAWWQKALFEQERNPNLKYGKTTANSAQRKLEATQGSIDALGVTDNRILNQMDVYKKKVQDVINLRDKFAKDPNAAKDPALVKQFQKAAYEAEQLRRGIKAVVDEEQKMAQMSMEQGFAPVELSADQITNLKATMVDMANASKQGRVEIKGWNDDNTKLYYTITDSKGAVQEMTMALGQGTNQLYTYRTATKETGTLMQQIFKGIKVKAKELISFVIGGGSIYKVVAMLKQGVQYVREIDLALTELKKVTNETEEAYDKFLKTAAKTGARLGSTISAVTEATATFAKLGYSMEQASEMAEAAIVYKNVGDNIASTEDAADSIISTLKGFGLEASESMKIVDKFNEVGNRFAITSQGIGEALRLSASALNEGKNSLDESIALITAANEVVRFMPRSHSNMVTRSDLKRGNS